MTSLTQSHFLQALGWATLNSIWQMALLWALYSSVNYFINFSSARKYKLSVAAMFLGFAWFVSNFIFYSLNRSSLFAFFENTMVHSNSLLHILLLSASVTYLLLLVLPAVRLFKNWQFVQLLKKDGQEKAQFEYRLFVQKIAFLLGINKKVKVAVSSLVMSPVTVGYVKPLILLPVAALNQLTPAQVEAILLHELSHIRRYDYLLNLVVSIIHTLLYFNPFAKMFMNTIEAEREACCDEMVLQFGYDKVSYASALLHLEKASGRHQVLTLAAAGKQNLRSRIEKIVGMKKKKTFRLVQIVPLVITMACVLLFNSVLIIQDAKNGQSIALAGKTMVLTPWQWKSNNQMFEAPFTGKNTVQSIAKATDKKAPVTDKNKIQLTVFNNVPEAVKPVEPVVNHVMPVAFDEVDGSLTKEQKENVKSAVEVTKKVASTLQWKEIEKSIGEVMDNREKAMAKQEYMQELNNVAWVNIEQNLKVNYDKLNWTAIEQNMDNAMQQVQLDSLRNVYTQALSELAKAEKNLKAKTPCLANPMPDVSVEDIQKAKCTLEKNLAAVKKAAAARQKKVVAL